MRSNSTVLVSLAWILLVLVGSTIAPWVLPGPTVIDLDHTLSSASTYRLLGTDELGRDLLSRVLNAARPTLVVTASATALDMALASALGLFAGYRGGWSDNVLRVAIDLFWTVPFVIFVVLIIAITGVSIVSLVVAIAAVNWVTAARVVRAEATRLRAQHFVHAAEAQGYSPTQIIVHHVVPAMSHTLIALATYTAIEVLTLESGLAFIGLSLPAPTPTWGGMLADGLGYLDSSAWPVVVPAGVMVLTLVSLQCLGRAAERGWSHATSV